MMNAADAFQSLIEQETQATIQAQRDEVDFLAALRREIESLTPDEAFLMLYFLCVAKTTAIPSL